ncbi:MAG TPA: glycosyltransferase [Caulobacteraceae bacterium]|nr:glycosyltransferase [Caulobacteraceae bacterium]
MSEEPCVRAILFKGPSQYDGTRTFIDEVAGALGRRGLVAEIVDLAGADNVEAAIAAAAGPPADLLFSINILGEHRDGAGRGMSEIFGAPHVVLHVDYVLSQATRLRATPPTSSLISIDPTQVEAIASVFGAQRFASVSFAPHAAVGEPGADDADAGAFAAARPIPLLWSGTLHLPGEPVWASQPPTLRRIYDDAVDLALSVEWMPPLAAFDQVLAANGNDPANPALQGARCDAMHIDVRVRALRRYDLIGRLAASGLPITICGNGWAAEAPRFRHATFLGPLPMPESARLMRTARIVVGTNGNFGAGSHERPLTAMLAGAAVVSDYSRFYAQAFAEDREIALFRWKALDDGLERLAQLAGNPAAAYALGIAGKARVLAAHRWDHRVDAILAAADASRAAIEAAKPTAG